MAIKVCDAIMGSGKSSAAINYMNTHRDRKYIYITPYLEEIERIKNSCPLLKLREPNNRLPEFGFKKYQHTLELMKNGENIVTTHNMFLRYTGEMTEYIRRWEYVLIIDEAVDVLKNSGISPSDMKMFRDAGLVKVEGEQIDFDSNYEYKWGVASKILAMTKSNKLIDIPQTNGGESYYYWLFSKEIFEAFKDIYVLTYMFEAQMMKYYFDIVGIKYAKIGVCRDTEGGYFFDEDNNRMPEYVRDLRNKIHIFDNPKLNAIGNNKHALSSSWYQRYSNESEQKQTLRKNVDNFFRNYYRDKPQKLRLWATFKNGESLIRQKGFYRDNIAFNSKATNDYREKQVLAYCVNVFMQPSEKNYLLNKGVDVQEDAYALSVMLQWIWRSAIRDGKEIWIYIPSKRMRNLLEEWIENTQAEYWTMEEVKNEQRETA